MNAGTAATATEGLGADLDAAVQPVQLADVRIGEGPRAGVIGRLEQASSIHLLLELG